MNNEEGGTRHTITEQVPNSQRVARRLIDDVVDDFGSMDESLDGLVSGIQTLKPGERGRRRKTGNGKR